MTDTITILGAGAMGSAIATPLRRAGWEVNLWGTWLDDHLLAACRAGEPHPRTGVPLAEGTRLFASDRLDEALDGASSVVLAVASVGVVDVARAALAGIGDADALLLTSKGFEKDAEGRVQLLPDALRELAATSGHRLPPVVAVGGPCKANEVAAERWTATIFGCRDREVAQSAASGAATTRYRAEVTDDESGVEICAPMKNVYAIALGIADGLGQGDGEPFHDLKAATFARAVHEMMVLTALVGGRSATAAGLAGVGDLEVTGLSGRNRLYGERIGRGEPAPEALAAMEAAELTVEGVPAARLARELIEQRDPTLWSGLRLFAAINEILDGASDAEERLAEAVLPRS